jgi:hypothetical protein
MYMDKVNVGPTCTAREADMQYCVSPVDRKVLACSNRDGDTVDGNVVDKLAPDVVIARFIKGTASSMRARSLVMSWMMNLISASFRARTWAEVASVLARSSAVAALSKRRARDWMSNLRDLVKETADSREVLPRAAINSIMSIAGEITYSSSASFRCRTPRKLKTDLNLVPESLL